MSLDNAFVASVLQTTLTQRQQADVKSARIRRAQTLRQNQAAESDRFEHTVESAEQLKAIHDERDEARRQRKRAPHRPSPSPDAPATDDDSHLDLTA